MRRLSTFSSLFAPKVRSQEVSNGSSSFDKFFPTPSKSKKPWEIKGIPKDEFFGNKYKMKSPELTKKLQEKVARQRRLREARKLHENPDYKKNYSKVLSQPFARNPLNEYIYGKHAVKAALWANKRKSFNKLFVKEEFIQNVDPDILELARKYKVKIELNTPKQQLTTFSQRGIHNGYVLETKPLHFPYATALGSCDPVNGEYSILTAESLDSSSEAIHNTVARRFTEKNQSSQTQKFPIGMYLDGNTDPQNVGAIIRSAYYMGVDFIVVPEVETAKLGGTCSKVSSGALELLDIYKTGSGLKFVEKSRANNWTIISAIAPEQKLNSSNKSKSYSEMIKSRTIPATELSVIAENAPVLLVLGNEGEGIRTNLLDKSDYLVSLDSSRLVPTDPVDSLNVSVATALLISKLIN